MNFRPMNIRLRNRKSFYSNALWFCDLRYFCKNLSVFLSYLTQEVWKCLNLPVQYLCKASIYTPHCIVMTVFHMSGQVVPYGKAFSTEAALKFFFFWMNRFVSFLCLIGGKPLPTLDTFQMLIAMFFICLLSRSFDKNFLRQ